LAEHENSTSHRPVRIGYSLAAVILLIALTGCVFEQIKDNIDSLQTLRDNSEKGVPDYNLGEDLSDSDGDGQADAFDAYPYDGNSIHAVNDNLAAESDKRQTPIKKAP